MNLFKIMQGIRSLAQAGKIDYQGAIKYLNELGVQMDGIVKQALDNVFKKGKARDPDFGDTVVKMQIDEQGIPFNPKTLTSIKEKREGIGPWQMSGDQDFSTMVDAFKKGQKESKEGVENLFQEKGPRVTDQMELFTKTKKLPKVKMGSRIDYDKIAAMEGIDVDLIRGKEWSEIMEIISAVRDKADGGRVGLNIGGQAKKSNTAPYDSRASIADYAKAVQNVSAGTDAQKLQDIGKYSLNQMQNSPNFFKAVGQGINQHMINNQMLRDAVDAKRITEDQYKLMGGWDVAKLTPQVGLGSIKIGGTPGDVGVASALYNAIKAGGIGLEKLGIKEKDPFNQYGDIGFFESIAKNYQGAKGLSPTDKALYESIISGKTQSDIDRFRSGLYAANQVDKATGDRLYGGNIENLYNQYKQNPSTFFYAGDDTQSMYDRFNKYYKAGGRVGFQQGGWADNLTGQAAAIYQSMNLGGHSDQTIQDTLKSLGYWDGDTGGGSGGVENIINTQQSIIPGAGGGGGSGLTGPDSYTQTWTSAGIPTAAQSTSFVNSPESVNALNQKIYDYMGTQMGPFSNDPLRSAYEKYSQEDFMAQNPEYFSQGNVQPERTGLMGMWDKTKDFFSGLGSPKIRGQLGTRLANQPRLPLPASIAGWSLSPFNEASRNYNPNMIGQLNFLEMQDNMIGRDPNSGHLKYGPESVLAGKNVISMFGTNNYEQALNDWLEEMEERGTIDGKWDIDNLSKFQREKYLKGQTELTNLVKEQQRLEEERRIAEEARKAEIAAIQQRVDRSETDINKAAAGNDSPSGASTVNPHSAYGKAKGYTGGNPNPHTATGWSGSSKKKALGGLIGYNQGGLATMFTRRR